MDAKHNLTIAFESSPLALRLLGPVDLLANGQQVPLPRSKKTRALLAYLAVTDRPHSRDRLCSLLWDVTDDPRGALRWSLSRLRKVLCVDADRIQADHLQVALSPFGIRIDACELSRMHRQGFVSMETYELERASTLYRGEFLEGLELPDFLDFRGWCIDQREQLRRGHAELLTEIVNRLREAPDKAVPYAKQRVQVDVFNLTAHQELLRLLLELGHVAEAQQRFEHAQRLFRQVSAPDAIALDQAWKVLRTRAPSAPVVAMAVPEATVEVERTPDQASPRFVGRQRLVVQLEALLDRARTSRQKQLAFVTGEPGMGKSRLAERMAASASHGGFVVVAGRAFEAESGRPFGPWADALGVDVQETVASDSPISRDGLFDTLRGRLATLAAHANGVLLVLDDLHWFDRDSTELLHHVIRTYDRSPLVVLMLARGGELPDNEAAVRLMRGLRREYTVHHTKLEPLSPEEIAALVGYRPEADAQHVHQVSGGNPLYALEFARAQRDGPTGTPPTLLELVRERVARLPDGAADVLRWGAVFGHGFDLHRLEGVITLSPDELVGALERLEQASLLHIDITRVRDRYVFSHALVREAIYSQLSQPRRRLMHRKVALLLEPLGAEPSVAAELAHHASLSGEAMLGVRACVGAGRHALRVFANGDAEALARRGLRLAEEIEEPHRIEMTLALLHVLYTARTPDRDEAAVQVRELADRALDLGLTRAAREGFQMLSYLRWEGSSLADAHANILQAERVSRLAEPAERATALAHAARCLVLLERNLHQAEAFVLEAEAVERRDGRASAAVSFAQGMIAAHRGDTQAAIDAFIEARSLARQQGEHLAEFGAIEHHLMLELDRGQHERATALAVDLVELGGRVRPGAEVHSARALLALTHLLSGHGTDETEMVQMIDAVRRADAKYELSYLLTRWAEHSLEQGRLDASRSLAMEALEVAQAMDRSSEIANALVVLARAALRRRSSAECNRLLALLEPLETKDLSARSRECVASFKATLRRRR